jgi:hypothetical protein
MTNLKQVTIEVDGLEVDHTNPLPVEAANDIQLQILYQLKKLNVYLGLITNEQLRDEDIERTEQ